MKKKVKKMPKYGTGTPEVTTTNTGGTTAGGGTTEGATGSGGGIGWGAIGAAATQIGKGMMHSFGVEDNSQLGVTLNNSMEWAELGGSIVPGWGHLIGGVAGATFGAFQKGGVDPYTGKIKYGGIFGRSKDSLLAEQNMIKNNIRATQMTEQKKAEYAMNPNNPNGGAVMAAEGGIMRRPVDALVSKGELIYDPTTQKLRQVPGSKGKPNRADDVFARLYEGDVVISNSPTMLMANGKTPAQNLMGMVDKYATGGTVKAREAIIKKVVNWQEANKTKHHENNKFAKGAIIDSTKLDEAMKKINFNKPKFGTELPDISDKSMASIDKHSAALISSRKAKKAGFDWKNVFDAASNYLPMAATLLKDYDYQRVQPRIGRNFNIPVDYNINDILVDNQEAHAINNYNVSQMGGSTGAYLAAAGQSAANLAKANSQARIYQKNKQNELIARNITQLNDWERYANNQLWAADVATAQNQGMAQQMKDQARKDRLEFYYGKRNDDMLTAMLKPMFEYGTPDEAYRQIYKRRIV